ncbi:hypothetical protein NL676_013564 [Syzygium grande]|nr:hypothetical protein NL676_013564 [Syzygium grande]
MSELVTESLTTDFTFLSRGAPGWFGHSLWPYLDSISLDGLSNGGATSSRDVGGRGVAATGRGVIGQPMILVDPTVLLRMCGSGQNCRDWLVDLNGKGDQLFKCSLVPMVIMATLGLTEVMVASGSTWISD